VPRTGVFLRWVISASNGSRPGAKGLSPAQPRRRFFLPVRQARSDPRDRHYPVERIVGNIVDIANTMSVGTWTRLSAVPVRSLKPRPQPWHRKRRSPCAVRSERSVVLVEQQCGHGILHLPSSEGLLYPNPPPDDKLARNLTEPPGPSRRAGGSPGQPDANRGGSRLPHSFSNRGPTVKRLFLRNSLIWKASFSYCGPGFKSSWSSPLGQVLL
jgi:hypothetical protein